MNVPGAARCSHQACPQLGNASLPHYRRRPLCSAGKPPHYIGFQFCRCNVSTCAKCEGWEQDRKNRLQSRARRWKRCRQHAGIVKAVFFPQFGGDPYLGAQTAVEKPQPLYDREYGLPILRKYLNYGQLLRDIREEKIMEVWHFRPFGGMNMGLEGPCIVVYRDGTAAQSFVPHDDFRIGYAMETHGVKAVLLPDIPSAQEVLQTKKHSDLTVAFATEVVPYILVGFILLAAIYQQKQRGDEDDRKRMRAAADKEASARQQEDQEVDETEEIVALFQQGVPPAEISARLKEQGVEMSEAEVAQVTAAFDANDTGMVYNTQAQAQIAAIAEGKKKAMEEEGDDMEEAEAFMRLRTLKVLQAVDPVKQKEMKAKRALKNLKLQYAADDRVYFDDVAGVQDAKDKLLEVVDFFRFPERFTRSGAKVPKGVILHGPPGTGKTLMARAVAGEAGVAFLSVNASEFVEMFAGVGASRVRDLFVQAKKLAPCIIFMDEVDAVARMRGGSQGNDERDQTLNQMLTQLDGFSDRTGVVVMCATNRFDVLDPAFTRPGRFDRIVRVDPPELEGRIQVLQVHLQGRPMRDVDLRELAVNAEGFSGAQLAQLCNQAASSALIRASRDRKNLRRRMLAELGPAPEGEGEGPEKAAAWEAARAGIEERVASEVPLEIVQADFVRALDEEQFGRLRAPYTDGTERRLACHECATALLCTLLPAIEPVEKMTIVPKEKYPLGQTVLEVNEARQRSNIYTRRYLEEQLLTVLAGRAAEEVVFGADGMSNLNNDRLNWARRIVQKMVVASAMTDSPAIGPRTLSVAEEFGDNDRGQIVMPRVSYDLHYAADVEMERVLNSSYAEAREMLSRNRAALDKLMDAVIAKSFTVDLDITDRDGSMTGDEIRAIVEQYAHPDDLERLRREKGELL